MTAAEFDARIRAVTGEASQGFRPAAGTPGRGRT